MYYSDYIIFSLIIQVDYFCLFTFLQNTSHLQQIEDYKCLFQTEKNPQKWLFNLIFFFSLLLTTSFEAMKTNESLKRNGVLVCT